MTSQRAIVRSVGIAIGLLSTAYFLFEVRKRWPEVASLRWSTGVVTGLMCAVALQCGATLTDAWSWAWLLRAMRVDAGTRDAISIFGISQFAKYLPGNVAQHMGRVAGAAGKGWQSGRVVLSLVVENGFALGAGGLLAASGGLLMSGGAEWQGSRAVLAALALVLGWLAGALLLQRLLSHPPALMRRLLAMDQPIELRPSFLLAYLLVHLASYLVIATGLAFILRGLAGDWPADLWRIPAAVALSWLAGYLVPGAPAGLGVREAALTALLGPSMGEGVVVAAALVWRVAALLTDATTLLVGLALRRREPALS